MERVIEAKFVHQMDLNGKNREFIEEKVSLKLILTPSEAEEFINAILSRYLKVLHLAMDGKEDENYYHFTSFGTPNPVYEEHLCFLKKLDIAVPAGSKVYKNIKVEIKKENKGKIQE